ncbi:MAG: phosphate signaling complex protein PhoU [bacterium]
MSLHLMRDLDNLKREILTMGGMVEEALDKSINAVMNRDADLAREVLDGEEAINTKELEISEEALKVLALHQPVAVDLRYVIAVIMVNNDLERVGDLAENIAERTLDMARLSEEPVPYDLSQMAETVRLMVRESLDSLVNQDVPKARRVCELDDEVDDLHREVYRIMRALMKEDPESVDRATHVISISRALERVADHATNIAEDVVFLVEGEIIRHGGIEEAE